MKLKTQTLGRDGGSLLEILVVVATVGLLAGLLMPAMTRMKDTSKSVQCVAALRNLGAGFLAYAGEHGGKFPLYPTNGKEPSESSSARSDKKLAWPWLISDYVGYDRDKGSPAVFACPAGIKHPDLTMAELRGYSMNLYVSDETFQNNTITGISQALLVEEWGVSPGTDRHHVMWPAMGAASNKTYQSYNSPENKERLAWRHQGGMNVLCKDGSIIRSQPGKSGWGDEIIWRIYEDGRKWKAGVLE